MVKKNSNNVNPTPREAPQLTAPRAMAAITPSAPSHE